MRLCWIFACAYAAIAADGVFGSESGEATPLTTVSVAVGDYLPLKVFTGFEVVDGCYLDTPHGDRIQFIPDDNPNDKYVLNDPVTLYGCQVTVKNLDENDSGIWELFYTSEGGAKSSQSYSVTVTRTRQDSESNGTGTAEDSSDEEDNRIMLPTIEYGSRIGVNVTITLSRQSYNEECYLQTPQGLDLKLEDAQIDGVQVFMTPTSFVSCMIVIGPMDDTLLGTWNLCGKHLDGQTEHERCQPGHIEWAINDPAQNWQTTVHPKFDHAVHYGFQMDPIVRGTGTLNTCHVVTPNGEDIVVTSESDYPGLRLVTNARDTTLCSVAIDVADATFLGDWVLYGTYHSSVIGYNVVSLPMTFSLYDQENPFNQAYNVTQLDTQYYVATVGQTITVNVNPPHNRAVRNDCQFITNDGEKYDQNTGTEPIATIPAILIMENRRSDCQLQIGPITKNMFGKWHLIGKFSVNNAAFSELQLPFNIVEEDPTNPIPDDVERTIQYLDPQHIYTTLGTSHTLTTSSGSQMSTDSCHVRLPNNLQYILRSGGSQAMFETVVQSSISCGVRVNVESEDAIGEWMLIARIRIRGTPFERRLPFIIHVEEKVAAVPETTSIAEGNDLYVRLEKPTPMFSTCTLTGPTRYNADLDEKYIENCGYIIRDFTLADAGTWEIVYGNKIKYRAQVQVTVIERFGSHDNESLVWKKNMPLNQTIGPEDAVYCKVENPSGLTVFQGFGKCNIILDRVKTEHEGIWRTTFGTAGRILTDTIEFMVKVVVPADKPEVVTSVVSSKPTVAMSCQVASEYEITACKFRDPSGKILLTSQGLGEDRYSFHGVGVSLQSNVTSRECGLRITNPVTEDLGLWRCVVETNVESYYGFLSVLCPWAMQDPAVAAAVVSVPTLTSDLQSVNAIEGDAVTMSCSVQSAIRYCYFRARNGTIYNVSPDTTDWYEYAGAGLDAGECSIRFPSLREQDSGAWSCHVGFHAPTEPEQRANFQVHVEALMNVAQYRLPKHPEILAIRGQVYQNHALEYCRFVRIDGQGFTSESVLEGYEDHSSLSNGECEIRIRNPSILELHPWTVVAKMVGREAELFGSTEHTLSIPVEEGPIHKESNFMMVWTCVLVISLVVFFVGLLLGPRKNREWTYRRATSVRNSLRRSFAKQALTEDPDMCRERTPTAA